MRWWTELPGKVGERVIILLPPGSCKMQTSAVENPINIKNSGTKNDSRWTLLRASIEPSPRSILVGGMHIAAIIDASKNTAKTMTRVRRIFAMSLYLRKYLRSAMSAAR